MSGEKTEDPTDQRKKQARSEGQIPRTPDLGSWGGLLIATFIIPMTARDTIAAGKQLVTGVVKVIADPQPEGVVNLLSAGLLTGVKVVAPLAASMFVIAILASGAQGGLMPASKLFKPSFKKLNPLTGLKRVFGGQALWEAVKIIIKTTVVGVAMYYSVRKVVPMLLTAGSLPMPVIVDTIAGTMLAVLRVAAVAGILLAAGDYAVIRRRIMKQIRMSKQDIKDEHKKSEGDPQLKGQIRAKQMEMSRQRMMSDLPKADVVLVNPTHVAVALRYDPAKGAPRVVAKGAGAIATKIRDKATEYRIPMVQDVPLARALYQGCDIGTEIPPEFYGTVARVLAFVMMLKSRGSAAGVHTNMPAA